MNAAIIRVRLQPSHFSAAYFPLSTSRDPKRQQDQPDVEPESGTLHVQTIEPELAGARDVARSVDLREPGQARSDGMTLLVAGDLLERDHPAVAANVDFARPERPRTDEAHVASQDVHELRQLVHGRRAQ